MSKYDINLRMGVNEFGMGVKFTATKGKNDWFHGKSQESEGLTCPV